MTPRRTHGDSPRWVLVHVVAAYAGLTAAIVGYAVIAVAPGWDDAPTPAPGVSVAVVAILLSLGRCYLARRPLPLVDRSYYRMAALFIGLYGLIGAWQVGSLVGVALLAHSYLLDREVAPDAGAHTVTPKADGS